MGNTEKSHDGGVIPSEKHRRPVICVVVSDMDLGMVARTLLRANERGFSAFVVVSGTDDPRVGELAERLGAHVLELDVSDGQLVETVESVARAFGFPGMVYTKSSEEIDFVRLEKQFEETDDYSLEAPTRDQSSGASSVVAAIPAYNEAETIGEVIESVRQYVDEVVIVDDGSTDETVTVAERAGATVVEHESNRGYGAAVKTAFTEAHDRNAEVLVTLDGDGQHDADDVPKLVEAVRERDANLVIGSRFHSDESHHVPRYRRVGLFVINILTNLSLGFTNLSLGRSWVSDTQSGLRAFDQQAIASLATDETLSDNMSASTDVLYHIQRNDYEIAEVGTTIYYEDHETSTQNPVYHGFSVVSNILRTIERERPLTFIGLPGLTTTLLGFGLGYWAVLNYLQTGSFPTGLVLFCIFTTVFGSLLALTGVILHSIKTHVEAIPDQLARQ